MSADDVDVFPTANTFESEVPHTPLDAYPASVAIVDHEEPS
jgi:hypothetical protein